VTVVPLAGLAVPPEYVIYTLVNMPVSDKVVPVADVFEKIGALHLAQVQVFTVV
jgi:hypothetical protein